VGINLVIPMSGLGSRFSDAGYATPKPLIPVHGVEMFKLVILNMLTADISTISLVVRSQFNLKGEIEGFGRSINREINVLEIDQISDGPAHSIAMCVETFSLVGPLLLVNSDQFFGPDLDLGRELANCDDGLIISIEDSDPKWSFAEVSDEGYVLRVREKEVISEFATTGLYYFSSAEVFLAAFREMRNLDERVNGEFYVGPAYNFAIERGARIRHLSLGPIQTAQFWGLGTPSDLEQFLHTPGSEGYVRDLERRFISPQETR
jgi:dTDP-glucose pyrophosphorylase